MSIPIIVWFLMGMAAGTFCTIALFWLAAVAEEDVSQDLDEYSENRIKVGGTD